MLILSKPIQHPTWPANIISTKKKNGQIHCYIDFCNLNKVCPKDEFPLPDIEILVDATASHSMFSLIDGFNGYNQIKMGPSDVKKVAVRTPIGKFYYTVVPLGLKSDGATYERTMTVIFHK